MSDLNIYWGEMHDNIYQLDNPPVPLEENIRAASEHLDFLSTAYYMTAHEEFIKNDSSGAKIRIEKMKPESQIEREWGQVQELTHKMNNPGRFVTFPGYEWQGNGQYGDHNVIHFSEGGPVSRACTLPELYQALRPLRALAIPHHTAYRVGHRGKNWKFIDEKITPFTEVFNVHGCSETDEEYIGMRTNPNLGPGIGGGTYQDALDAGLKIGAICSTDQFGYFSGRYGWGLAACLAPELTRESLWDAFTHRRVYGVTGDRIKLDFRLNGTCMGGTVNAGGARRVDVAVEGFDALDRVELLRNGRVIHTWCHQGSWDMPAGGQTGRFKLRIEAGWGGMAEILKRPDRVWTGSVQLGAGRVISSTPCWGTPGQSQPVLSGNRADFTLAAPQPTRPTYPINKLQNAHIFEIESSLDQNVRIEMDQLHLQVPLAELAARSHILSDDASGAALFNEFGIVNPGPEYQVDPYVGFVDKVKIHRLIPEAGYKKTFSFSDESELSGNAHYRIRVEQRNGQKAWSSPVWVENK